MGCSGSKTKGGDANPRETVGGRNGAHLVEPLRPSDVMTSSEGQAAPRVIDWNSPAAQIAHAKPTKSAMKKPMQKEEPIAPAADRRGGARREGRTGNALADGSDGEEDLGLSNRSFVKEDLTGSFHNLSFVTEKGDCRVEKGVMAPSAQKIPAPASSDQGTSRGPSEPGLLSPHSSDSELVLVCLDCGREVDESEVGLLCPVTARLHG